MEGKWDIYWELIRGEQRQQLLSWMKRERYWGLQPEEVPTIRQMGWHLRLQK